MTPIAIASLSALAGLFVAVDARTGDQRLVLAGMRSGVVLAARLAVIGLAGALATAVSLGAAGTVFDARQWGVYAAANLLIAVTYGLLGVLLGLVFGRVGGVFVAFLVPFLDLGIAQSPMLRSDPAAWATFLPGYGGMRILLDGGLTATFDATAGLLLAVLWLVGLAAVATVLFHGATRPAACPLRRGEPSMPGIPLSLQLLIVASVIVGIVVVSAVLARASRTSGRDGAGDQQG